MWWRIAPAIRAEFEDWHSHEHFPERMSIPGFRRGSRWADQEGGEGFFVLYELERYETLVSPGYLARLNDPTPWSKKMMPHHRDMVRSQCRIIDSFGGGIAQHMATLRFSPQAGEDASAWRDLRSSLAALAERPGITGAHVLRTDTPAHAPTAEQQIRGGDATADWVVLLSGYDAADTRAAASEVQSILAPLAGGSTAILSSHYRLSYSLTSDDVGPSGIET
jgi:hypothetical protein